MYKDVLKNLNTAFTVLFTIECVLKLLAFGVRVSYVVPVDRFMTN